MKTLLFTGASGFLGHFLLPILDTKYYVSTLDLQDADYNYNLSKEGFELNKQFNIVLHAAGKAHSIPQSEEEKQAFFDVNYKGTVNLCRALEKIGVPCSFIFISSVAVYGCDSGKNITEEHPLNGKTPYALSKIQAEEFLIDWCRNHDVILTIFRPSLIAGPNPPGNLKDMINGIKKGLYFSIGGGKARKSILMVEDIARLIPLVTEKGGIYNICDDEHPCFKQLGILISNQLGKRVPLNIPYIIAKFMALCGDAIGKKAPINSLKLKKITQSLTFSNKKVKETFGWQPLNVLENFKI